MAGGFGVASAGGSGGPPLKKFKISSVLDQSDDSEIQLKTRAELVKYYENHREITGAEPLPEVEPTDIQVAAMEEKVVTRDEAPSLPFNQTVHGGRQRYQGHQTCRPGRPASKCTGRCSSC